MSVNRADRPGENDYDGYDIVSLAIDLAAAWDTELVRRARTAMAAGSRPRSRLANFLKIWPHGQSAIGSQISSATSRTRSGCS
jgi:hypothetical protein